MSMISYIYEMLSTKMYGWVWVPEEKCYKWLPLKDEKQNFDFRCTTVHVFEEVAIWVLVGVSIGVITIALYILWEMV